MEELNILKKDWKKTGNSYPSLTENEIYAMLHKKSSSVVKWILIISILEFVFWGVGSALYSMFGNSPVKAPMFIEVLDYVHYAILIVFISLFYRNYRRIAIEKPVKELMANIINVRKVVKIYVLYNLAIIFISMLCGVFLYENSAAPKGHHVAILVVSIILVIIFVAFIMLIYRLLYGRLLTKLTKNYVELEKIKS